MRILVADGIGTADARSGVADAVATRLSRLTVASVERVRWPAAMAGVGGTGTWITGAGVGLRDLVLRVDGTDDDLLLLGYSGGNRIVHDFLDRHPEHRHRVRAVGLVSDPFRPRGRRQRGEADPGGWGLCGERPGPVPGRTVWSAVPGDVITAADADSVLRTAADLAANVPGGLCRDLRTLVTTGHFQLHWQIDRARAHPGRWAGGLGGRLARARVDVRRYFTGWHTTHYTRSVDGRSSLAHRLAEEMAEIARSRTGDDLADLAHAQVDSRLPVGSGT